MFYAFTKLSIEPDYFDEVVAAVGKLAVSVREEDGCVEYKLVKINGEDNCVAFYEVWASPEAFITHVQAGDQEGTPLQEFGQLMQKAEKHSETLHYDGIDLV